MDSHNFMCLLYARFSRELGKSMFLLCGAMMLGCSGGEQSSDLGQEQARLESCPTADQPARTGRLELAEISEASGLTRSQRNAGVFYTHNDSGGDPEVFAVDGAGRLLAKIAVSGAKAKDWEDIGVGPGPDSASYVYVGDIGDNALARANVTVYRFREPAIDPDDKKLSLSVSAEALKFSYPDGAHNAETLLIDPVTGDLSIVTKSDSGSRVYVARPPFDSETVRELEYVTAVDFSSTGSALATGGAVAPDGSAILIRTYSAAMFFPRSLSAPIEDAFREAGCELRTASEQQGEAISFVNDASQFITLSEGASAGLFRVTIEP